MGLVSKNRHMPKWCPWVVWVVWNPIDAVGCRNEHTGVTDHAKVTTTALVVVALVFHALKMPLQWWELLILGTLCFSSLWLFSVLLKSGIFKGEFLDSHAKSTVDEHVEHSTTVTIRQERDPELGIDPA